MQVKETFGGIDASQPKNHFKVTLIEKATGKVVSEQEFDNTVGTARLQQCNVAYKQWANMGDFSGCGGLTSALQDNTTTLALFDDDYGLSADSAYLKAFQFDSVNGRLPVYVNQDSNPRVTGYCYQNATVPAGTHGGGYLGVASGLGNYRKRTMTYEWGTTQGNGTIKAVGYVPSDMVSGSSDYGILVVGKVPELADTSYYTYAGFKTQGGDKHLYFVTRDKVLNNVVVIKASDRSVVAVKTLTNPSGLWSVSQKDIVYTPVGGGQLYGIVSLQPSSGGFTFRKAAESGSMTFGSDTAVTATLPGGWASATVQAVTSDDTYIYAYVTKNGDAASAILTFDPATDTIVGIVETPTGFGGSSTIDSQLFNICPNTGKLLTIWNNYRIVEWSGITNPGSMVTIGRWDPAAYNPYASYRTFLHYETADRLVGCLANSTYGSAHYGKFLEFNRGNYFTYAVLPVAITKSNTQSLRIEYTLNY